jgi:hypothetical protein
MPAPERLLPLFKFRSVPSVAIRRIGRQACLSALGPEMLRGEPLGFH